MPYRDLERRRGYMRDYQRLRRAGKTRKTLANPVTPLFRTKSVEDVTLLLDESLCEVRAIQDKSPGTILAKARAIGSLALVLLKALEVGQLEARVSALEAALENPRGGGAGRWRP